MRLTTLPGGIVSDKYAGIRDRLTQEHTDLLHQLTEMGINPTSGNPTEVEFEHGFADSGAAAAEKANLLTVADTLKDTLSEVIAALKSLDDGTYGTCTQCGEPIPFERLEARPQSRICFTCKQRNGG